ncbi:MULTISPECIES: DUF4383 domain-containing protein [unclassified Nocardiopsis]|uniref:DUF4383 domain-containing protein n=1 Tax=unclassified Nocardiopsis TaxID=2649073 RepID=UPI000AE3D905|nr:DUF4383 domain-containing protein [Nocardiopsis sp. TSRI0078]
MSDRTSTQGATSLSRQPIRLTALIVGIVFLLVGLMGFIPGVTTNYDQMQFAGHQSEAQLLGIFQVSILHNLVHLLFGVAGVAMARTAALAKLFLVGGGVVYLVLWLYGLVIDLDSAANFVPLDSADNWLHLGLGVGMIALGFLLAPTRRSGR